MSQISLEEKLAEALIVKFVETKQYDSEEGILLGPTSERSRSVRFDEALTRNGSLEELASHSSFLSADGFVNQTVVRVDYGKMMQPLRLISGTTLGKDQVVSPFLAKLCGLVREMGNNESITYNTFNQTLGWNKELVDAVIDAGYMNKKDFKSGKVTATTLRKVLGRVYPVLEEKHAEIYARTGSRDTTTGTIPKGIYFSTNFKRDNEVLSGGFGNVYAVVVGFKVEEDAVSEWNDLKQELGLARMDIRPVPYLVERDSNRYIITFVTGDYYKVAAFNKRIAKNGRFTCRSSKLVDNPRVMVRDLSNGETIDHFAKEDDAKYEGAFTQIVNAIPNL
jgi:hypothetical protein